MSEKPIQRLPASADTAEYLVEYHPYDPRLPQVFEAIKALVHEVAGSASIEHIGSSSVPGVGGRNVLDIAVVCDDSLQPMVRDALSSLGFEAAPFPHYLPVLVGRTSYDGSPFDILLYPIEPHSPVLRDWLKLRDHLRSHPADAQAYDAAKRAAIAEGRVAGDDYQDAKAPFLAALTAKLFP